MAEAARITVLSGAGISTDSGIPDFRGPNGLWTRDPAAERMSSFQAYRDDPDVRLRSWQARAVAPGVGRRRRTPRTARSWTSSGPGGWCRS